GIRGQAARLHPAAAPGRGGGSGVGDRLRLGQLAARGVRPQAPGDGGAAPLRGDGVLLLAEELRTGDIAVVGSNEYADWSAHLLTWEECEQHLAAFCAEVGLPETAEGFVAHLKHRHLDASMELESGYEDNADLFIDDGVPRLKKRRSPGSPKAAEKLFEAIEARMPERSLLGIVARTAYWLGWHHCFGPASGSDPKIRDVLGRYSLAVFTGGINIGPTEAARHIAGITARELSMVRNRHIDLTKLNAAIA